MPQNPEDGALTELVDMGFALEKAQKALAHTSTGTDIQAAVGILLHQAHEDSRTKSKPPNQSQLNSGLRGNSRRTSKGRHDEPPPAWMRQTPSHARADHESQSEEKDVAQYASEISNTLFKSANTLWKSGQKKMQQAVADFQQDRDSSQPRWMQESQVPTAPPRREEGVVSKITMKTTNEVVMLESGRSPSSAAPRREPRNSLERRPVNDRPQAPTVPSERTRRAPPSTKPQPPPSQFNSKRPDRLTRQEADSESAQAYVSPARRKKPSPAPNISQPTLDIFSPTPQKPVAQPKPPVAPSPGLANGHAALPTLAPRPKVSRRKIPELAPGALATCTRHRQSGTTAFRRGDYSSANSSYSAALSSLPYDHPLTAVLYCNRSLTALKIGDTKAAVSDADAALRVIGPSNGDDESILIGGNEGEKPLREFFSKALMRKAEALEHSEKWSEAAKVWRDAVQAGVGGPVAIQGRNRCEKASAPPSVGTSAVGVKQRAPVTQTPPARVKQSAIADLAGSSAVSSANSEAVSRLRAANAAAAAASDEAFALNDSVEARLSSWKAGKADNLRALLASLDTVLWRDSGWQKVGLSDLVMPNRVKIVYMKAIGRVHPDKVS